MATVPKAVLEQMASFLPSRERFGTIRRVSRAFAALPSSLRQEPQFYVDVMSYDRGLFHSPTIQALGVFTITQIRDLVHDISTGTIPILPTPVYDNTLRFLYAPTGRRIVQQSAVAIGGAPWVQSTRPDVRASLQPVGPPNTWTPFTPKQLMGDYAPREVDWLIGQLYDAADRVITEDRAIAARRAEAQRAFEQLPPQIATGIISRFLSTNDG